MIRQAKESDCTAICQIYNYYIENTVITFEENTISSEEMAERIRKTRTQYPWLVYEEDGIIIGYSYASSWKERSAYRYSVESTVYLKNGYERKGYGKKLYKELITELKKSKYHSVIGVIALPNKNSIMLHEKMGFKKIGAFKEVGYKMNKWIDVGYWQLELDN